MRIQVWHLLVLLVPVVALGVGIAVAFAMAKRPFTSEPKDPSWEQWFALGALVLGLLLVVMGQPVGGLLLLLAVVWGVTALYRHLRLRRYVEHLRAQRAARQGA